MVSLIGGVDSGRTVTCDVEDIMRDHSRDEGNVCDVSAAELGLLVCYRRWYE